MNTVQKFISFFDLKESEETAAKPIDSKEIKDFLQLLRDGEFPTEIAVKDAK
jgi:hypothetical protein